MPELGQSCKKDCERDETVAMEFIPVKPRSR